MLFNLNGCFSYFNFSLFVLLPFFLLNLSELFPLVRVSTVLIIFFRLFLLLFALYLQNRIASGSLYVSHVSIYTYLSGRPSKIKSRGRKNERNNNSTIPTRQPKKEDHKLRLFSCKVNLVKCPLFLPILRVKQIQF